MSEARRQDLQVWLRQQLNQAFDMEAVSGDASFRRYFRLRCGDVSYIAMDAPPWQEDSRPFVAVARAMAELGLNVPEVVAEDLEQGFLLLTDLGDTQYAQVIEADNADELYHDALMALLRLQAGPIPPGLLPDYDAALLQREIALFADWLLARHLGMRLEGARQAQWRQACQGLVGTALEQPQVWVHRDYHSRNLMYCPNNNPGILDFQDAVRGPITYDLVSLLRDCYIAWPRQRVAAWQENYRQQLVRHGLLSDAVGREAFARWCDWMGIQRHLKAAGIFARLYHRDGKPGYLADIPRTVSYIVQASRDYPQLACVRQLAQDVLDRLDPQTGLLR